MDIKDRVRKVNVENMSEETLESAINEISSKIIAMAKHTEEEANRLLFIYGLECKMSIEITGKKQINQE